ncbi:MAG: MFS transporter [Actinomycetota bacterium]|nr:MFS transporter [Actinomycetota bacterium]
MLVDTLGWRAIFAFNAALGLPVIALAARHVRESRDPDPSPLDWPGLATLCVGLFLVVFAVLRGNALGWTSLPVLGFMALGAVALVGFVAVERARARPMVDPALFANRTFTGASVVVAALAAATFGAFVFLTLFLLDVQGRDPVEAGLVLAPLAVVSFLVSALAGRANERLPLRAALVGGLVVCAAGLAGLRGLDADSSWPRIALPLALTGAGVGLVNPLATFAHLGVLPPSHGGLASALNNTARQLGLAVGIAVLGALLQAGVRTGLAPATAPSGRSGAPCSLAWPTATCPRPWPPRRPPPARGSRAPTGSPSSAPWTGSSS